MTHRPPPPDMTRWNRAGLPRFRYVNDNAVSHLESLRAALAASFPDWANTQDEGPQTPDARRKRMLARYRQPRRDLGWEMARAFARAAHILTEHIDAFANEGFIGTATQWEYLKRLVDPLDYRPRPPSSAQTIVALLAKGNPGIVPAGLQMQYTPVDGTPPLLFETLADLAVNSALNDLRLKHWNRNSSSFTPAAVSVPADPKSSPWRLPDGEHGISAGQPAIIRQNVQWLAASVGLAEQGILCLVANPVSQGLAEWIKGDTEVLVEPDRVWKPRLNGGNAFKVVASSPLSAGQLVFWRKDGSSGFARIANVDADMITLGQITPPGARLVPGTTLYAAQEQGPDHYKANGNQWRFALRARGNNNSTHLRLIGIDNSDVLNPSEIASVMLAGRLPGANEDSFAYLPDTVVATSIGVYDPDNSTQLATTDTAAGVASIIIPGSPGKLRGSDLVMAVSKAGARQVLSIASIITSADSFQINFGPAPVQLADIALLQGPFKRSLRPVGFDVNTGTITSMTLDIDGEGPLPAELTPGKTLLVEPALPSATLKAFQATVTDVRHSDRVLTITTESAGFAGYVVSDVVIRANAVLAGHGESKPSTILGSGDATRNSQDFVIEKNDIAFVPDETLEAGLRASVTIDVDGRRYAEVSTLRDSEPDDPHYEAQTTEAGHVRLVFGDGFHGRRLPTGRNNIAASWRVGTGARGNNLPPHVFKDPVRPHPFVSGLRQPLSTWGGQDRETLDGIRQNAPRSLAALGRAVSLADIEHLARTQPGIWNAKAFHLTEGAGRNELIDVILVPANDAPLGNLASALRTRLAANATPGLKFNIRRFEPVYLRLAVDLRINSREFNPVDVEAAVIESLLASFKLENRKPGAPLLRSAVYAVIEAVPGVANADASLFAGQAEPLLSANKQALLPSRRGPGGQIWSIRPTPQQVVYLEDAVAITITRQEAFT